MYFSSTDLNFFDVSPSKIMCFFFIDFKARFKNQYAKYDFTRSSRRGKQLPPYTVYLLCWLKTNRPLPSTQPLAPGLLPTCRSAFALTPIFTAGNDETDDTHTHQSTLFSQARTHTLNIFLMFQDSSWNKDKDIYEH